MPACCSVERAEVAEAGELAAHSAPEQLSNMVAYLMLAVVPAQGACAVFIISGMGEMAGALTCRVTWKEPSPMNASTRLSPCKAAWYPRSAPTLQPMDPYCIWNSNLQQIGYRVCEHRGL